MNRRRINKMFRNYNKIYCFEAAFESNFLEEPTRRCIENKFTDYKDWMGIYSNLAPSLYCIVENDLPFFYDHLQDFQSIQFNFQILTFDNLKLIAPYNTEDECLRVIKKFVHDDREYTLICSILEHMSFQKSMTNFNFSYQPLTDILNIDYMIYNDNHSFRFTFTLEKGDTTFRFSYRKNRKTDYFHEKNGTFSFEEFFNEAISVNGLQFFTVNDLSSFNSDVVDLAVNTEMFIY